MTHCLMAARDFEKKAGAQISDDLRPLFHLTPYTGWMNDPNGFSFYQGQYHLFYQYNPYDTQWSTMHWGHAVSYDLLNWTYLPVALAPDQPYDSAGCFSGSAIELPDGRHLLMYTGVQKHNGNEYQTQCLAVGDGLEYEKFQGNPVLDARILPADKSPYDFRDPKIWQKKDGTYCCVVGTCNSVRNGTILLFHSEDAFHWTLEGTLIDNDGTKGGMWECPDFFELDGQHVCLSSPQDMLPEGYEYRNGNGTLCLIGQFDDKTKKFIPHIHQAIDYGIDFYAPQTILTPDGRRVMIGWMHNWDACSPAGARGRKWFGQMSLPRELTVRNHRLYQQPVRELAEYRKGKISYKDVCFQGEKTLDGIAGRTIELEMVIQPGDLQSKYRRFSMLFAKGETTFSSLSFCPEDSLLTIDRKFSGSRRDYIHQRSCRVSLEKGILRLHVVLDKFSIEVFINDGEQVMTASIYTDISAQEISFVADGLVSMNIKKYSLFAKD